MEARRALQALASLMVIGCGLGLRTWNITVQPMFQPQRGNQVICSSVAIPANESWIVVGFDYKDARPGTHLGFNLCKEPGFRDPEHEGAVWDCGLDSSNTRYSKAGSCADGLDHTGLARAPAGPRLDFPPGVGFAVGGDSGVHFLVFGVHYPHEQHVYPDNVTYVLTMADRREAGARFASVHTISLTTYDWLPPLSLSSLETAYEVRQDVHLLPWGFEAHTHGANNSLQMWVVSPDGEWTRLGRLVKDTLHEAERDKSVSFLPVEHPDRVIVKGDRIVTQCLMLNAREQAVKVRASGDGQEMCVGKLAYYSWTGQQLRDSDLYNDRTRAGARGLDWLDDPVLRSHHQPVRRLTAAEVAAARALAARGASE